VRAKAAISFLIKTSKVVTLDAFCQWRSNSIRGDVNGVVSKGLIFWMDDRRQIGQAAQSMTELAGQLSTIVSMFKTKV
jgi:hypothetical protein